MGMPAEWMVSECLGLDPDLLGFLPQPTVALMMNAEFLKKKEDRVRGATDTTCEFYMKQTRVLNNACGIIASLHAIYNNPAYIKPLEDSILAKYLEMSKE